MKSLKTTSLKVTGTFKIYQKLHAPWQFWLPHNTHLLRGYWLHSTCKQLVTSFFRSLKVSRTHMWIFQLHKKSASLLLYQEQWHICFCLFWMHTIRKICKLVIISSSHSSTGFLCSSVDINLEWCVFVPWDTRKVIYQAFSLPQGYYPFFSSPCLKYVAYRNLHHNFSAKFAKKKKL